MSKLTLKPQPLGVREKKFEFYQTRYVIQVKKLSVTTSYFKQALAFEIRPSGQDGLTYFMRDQVLIMAHENPKLEQVPPYCFAYIGVKRLENYYHQLQHSGAIIVSPLKDTGSGWNELTIETPDQHQIVFAEPN